MDPLGVVVGHVVSEQTPEMTFAEDDHVIEKLAPAGPDPPFGDRVLPGAAVRRAHGIDPKPLIAAGLGRRQPVGPHTFLDAGIAIQAVDTVAGIIRALPR